MDLSIFDDLSIDITNLIGRYVSDYHRQRLNFRKVNSDLINNKEWVQIRMDRPLELFKRMGGNTPIHPARIFLKDPTEGWDILSEITLHYHSFMFHKLSRAHTCLNNKHPVLLNDNLLKIKKFKIDSLCENKEIVINDLKYRTIKVKSGDFRSPSFTKDVDVVVVGNMTENDMIIKYKKKFGKKNFNRVKNTIECQPRKGLRGWPSDEQEKEKKLLLWKGLMA